MIHLIVYLVLALVLAIIALAVMIVVWPVWRFAVWCAERAERKQGVIANARQEVIVPPLAGSELTDALDDQYFTDQDNRRAQCSVRWGHRCRFPNCVCD